MIRHCVCIRLTSLKTKSFLHNISLAPFVSLPKGAFCWVDLEHLYTLINYYETQSKINSNR